MISGTANSPRPVSPTRRDRATITRADQVRVLASPARQEIVDALETAGACTIARLAELMGRPPDALYFHVRRLLKVGLVVELDPVKKGRHVATAYDVAWRPMRLSYDRPLKPRDVTRVVASVLRLAGRDFARAVESGEGPTDGPRRSVWGGRAKGWLTTGEIQRVSHLLAEASDIIRASRPDAPAPAGEPRRPVALSFVLAPVAVSERARPRSKNAPLAGASTESR